jgi:hypothetical protein
LELARLLSSTRPAPKAADWATKARPPTYAEYWNVKNENKFITVYHGGGFRFLSDFFRGLETGYGIDNLHSNNGNESMSGSGIMVAVAKDLPDNYTPEQYSALGSLYHFDDPAVLTFEVQLKDLDSAPRNDEAGFRSEFRHQVRKIKLTNQVTGITYEGENLDDLLSKLPSHERGS